jgi:hypothetical protein
MSDTNSTSSFREAIQTAVEDATDNGLPQHRIEEILQTEAQNVRENRRVYEVFVFECPKANCEETHTELIDQSTILCDVCDQPSGLDGSWSDDGVEIFRFTCDEGTHSIRAHTVDNDDLTCSIHGTSLSLLQSYTTEEGLGTDQPSG